MTKENWEEENIQKDLTYIPSSKESKVILDIIKSKVVLENWEEEFENIWSKEFAPESYDSKVVIKSFISNLLTSQLQELIDEVEGVKRDITSGNQYSQGYKKALSDIQTLIRNRIKNI